MSQVRVRFAPSPTGYLHVGGARTALYNWLFAKNQGGKFILRIEDTDQVRSNDQALKMQIEDLEWLGLDWDEGPDKKDQSKSFGPYPPYRQSQRKDIYKEHADRILNSGGAFYCFCTDEELEAKKQAAMKMGKTPQYDGKCRKIPLEEARKKSAAGEKGAVRFHVKVKKDYKLQDLIRGEVVFPSDMVGDFVILRSDGHPTYNFCCVIDDALMKVTHVYRAEEHLSNTVRQMMLYEYFGYELPKFGHLSLMLGEDRQKLSKRHGATSCNEFKQKGYLPEALKNFIALCGWSSPDAKEVLTPEELIKNFDGTRFNPAPSVFDETKLKWMNSVHLRALSHDELWKRIFSFWNEYKTQIDLSFDLNQLDSDTVWRDKLLDSVKTAMETLADFFVQVKPILDVPELKEDSKSVVSANKQVVETWYSELSKFKDDHFLTDQEFDNLQNSVKDITKASGKNLFQPIRVAVIGVPQGIELKKLVPLVTVRELKARAQGCIR